MVFLGRTGAAVCTQGDQHIRHGRSTSLEPTMIRHGTRSSVQLQLAYLTDRLCHLLH